MTDKVQKIRKEVERLRNEIIQEREKGYGSDADDTCILELQNVLTYIDSLQEEPVSEKLEEASKNYALNNTPWDDCKDEMQESFKAGAKWQKKTDESITNDLGEYLYELSKQFPEVSFAKLSRIAVRVAKWQKENLWKHADGDDLPDIDKEVIAILDYDFGHYKVVYAHRPNPNGWDGTNIDTGEKEHFEPEIYDKGGWNQPHVLYWLDTILPYEENKIIKEL